jgi:hypothetical protein
MAIYAGIHVPAVAVAGGFKHGKMFGGYILNNKRQIDLPGRSLRFFGVEKRCGEGNAEDINILPADKFRRQYAV